MGLDIIAQVLVYGIITGSLYGLAAAGIALIFGVMNVLQVAHGSLIMLGGYMCFWLFYFFRIDPLISIPLVMIVFLMVGVVLYRIFFSSVIRLPVDEKISISVLLSFGLILIIENLAILAWTADVRTITPFYKGLTFKFLGLRLPYPGLACTALAVALILALHLFLQKTSTGRSLRATAQDWKAASMVGVNINRTYSLSFGIATALAAVTGVLIILGSSVDPNIGMTWTIKGLIVTVLAGTGNIGGIFVCGLFFGVLESIGSMLIGPYKELIGLVLFLMILIWKPQGLFRKA